MVRLNKKNADQVVPVVHLTHAFALILELLRYTMVGYGVALKGVHFIVLKSLR